MTVDIYNEGDLNKYITDTVYAGEPLPDIKKDELNKSEYVKNNQDVIVKAMVAQYLKLRLRQHLSEENSCLSVVEQSSALPEWSQKKIAAGGSIFNFNRDDVSDELQKNIVQVRDFLYSEVNEKITNKIITAEKTDVSRFDGAMKSGAKANRLETENLGIKLDEIKNWGHIDTFDKAIEQAMQWQEKEELKRKAKKLQSEANDGTEFIMNLSNGLKVVKLNNTAARTLEGINMGHCLKTGVFNDETEVYSIRTPDDKSHVTIEIFENEIIQCKGKENKAPVKKYIPYAQEFIKSTGFNISGDILNVEMIKDGKDVYHNLFDMPKEGIEVSSNLNFFFDKYEGDASQIDFSKIKSDGLVAFQGCKKMLSSMDFSNMKKMVVVDCEINNSEIKWPMGGEVTMIGVEITTPQDFSQIDTMIMTNSKVKSDVKWPSGKVEINNVSFNANLDFSNVEKLSVQNPKFVTTEEIILPPMDKFDGTKHDWVVNLPEENYFDAEIFIRHAEPVTKPQGSSLIDIASFKNTQR